MKNLSIDRIVLRHISIPMKEPFRISNGVVSQKESIIVELYSGEFVGYGEASPMSGSFYSSETPATTWTALERDLVPALLALPELEPHLSVETLNAYGLEPFARAGIEGAVWDLYAQSNRITLQEIFQSPIGMIPSGVAVGMYDSIGMLLDRIERYRKDGYQRVKIKIAPGWDFEPLVEIRMQFGNKLQLMVDANGAYNFDEHFDLLCSLDEFELMMIEQPFAADALDESAELSHSIDTPICLDESADSLASLETIIKKHAATILNIKVQRVGGLWNAKKMLERARAAKLKCWLGTMPELGIASMQALVLASLPGFSYPTDIEASSRWFEDDVIEPPLEIDKKGFIVLPKDGWKVNPEKLEKYTINKKEFWR
ncbi:MAG TPA: o-succinylbenzoate synthase [Candidatus Kapabacteria bacterium]|jgi:O-succinylbenzoate synthase